ncbi:hypothetical protein JB92DRAFT_2895176 [Gautieria morchelliformis]|nr:hypothetical protein JB92DRAFT_2895176 [Gautieria morchelliformis]
MLGILWYAYLLSDRLRALVMALGAADGNKTTGNHFIFETHARFPVHRKNSFESRARVQ